MPRVQVVSVGVAMTFKELCAREGLSPLRCFYQLQKKEKVSAGKELFAISNDGQEVQPASKVRMQLTLPPAGSDLAPALVPVGWTLFVESTSHSRRLPAGSKAAVAVAGDAPVPLKRPALAKRPAPAASAAAPVTKRAKSGEGPAASSARSGSLGGSTPMSAAVTKSDGDGWTWHGTLMFFEHGKTKPSSKIAAFDYDGCLANTSLFKKGPDAWSILFPGHTEEVWRDLHAAGYKLAILTNQSEIGKAKASFDKTVAEKKARLCGFAKKIGFPCQILVATAVASAKDAYRKPAIGMWEFLEHHKNGGVAVNRSQSLFCGDAAGRKKDHSDCDLKMAEALGVPFFREDQMFKERKYKALFGK